MQNKHKLKVIKSQLCIVISCRRRVVAIAARAGGRGGSWAASGRAGTCEAVLCRPRRVAVEILVAITKSR